MILFHTYREFYLSLCALGLGVLLGAWGVEVRAYRIKCQFWDLKVKYQRLVEQYTADMDRSA